MPGSRRPASHPWTTVRTEQLGVGLQLGGTAAQAQATAHSARLNPHSLTEEQAHLPRAEWIPNSLIWYGLGESFLGF